MTRGHRPRLKSLYSVNTTELQRFRGTVLHPVIGRACAVEVCIDLFGIAVNSEHERVGHGQVS